MIRLIFMTTIAGSILLSACCAQAPTEFVIQDAMLHLRATAEREWASFPEHPQAISMDRLFDVSENATEWTLSLQQVDVKQTWQVKINDKVIGRLVRDENKLITDLPIPPQALRNGENRLQIIQSGNESDDIRVGKVKLLSGSPAEVRGESTVIIDLTNEARVPIPGRITIVNINGSLMPVAVEANKQLAVREGVIYTSTGTATFSVAAGKYRIYASRGLEYNAPSVTLDVGSGELFKRTLELSPVIDTTGWVACDTHVHTLTYSGHGDCTIEERMATLAGEAIELPIATDHNKHIDYRTTATDLNVANHFTPVIGNEVTTKQGHFNVFPVAAATTATPDFNTTDWQALFAEIYQTPDVKIAILNHARDIHSGFRPFSPRHHISISGENLDDRKLAANAMEVINSGAVQTDAMELFRDWCGLINRGHQITPVGSSDSHDVSRYIVGQGRTYIRCDDTDPANIDVGAATNAFLRGNVIVSYGLMADLSVNGKGPGDLAQLGEDPVTVDVQVRGPNWTKCNRVDLYVNGRRFADEAVEHKSDPSIGVLKQLSWTIPTDQLTHDVWLTVVARGPGIKQPFWPTAKPYQPDSPNFQPYTFSCTGPLKLDVDGDGKFSAPFDYATQIIDEAGGSLDDALEASGQHGHAVAIQVASLLTAGGIDWQADDVAKIVNSAPPLVRDAITQYRKAWRESQIARTENRE